MNPRLAPDLFKASYFGCEYVRTINKCSEVETQILWHVADREFEHRITILLLFSVLYSGNQVPFFL